MKLITSFLLTAKPLARSKLNLKASQLTGVEEQSGKYGKDLLDIYPKWREPLPFAYESTGVETQFTNQFDPSPKSRNVFGFHRPETLLEYLEPDHQLNTRLSDLPVADQMPTSNLACYNPKNRHERKDSERFKSFSYDELLKRDKLNLDIFWLKDESLEDSANLPNPDIIAAEIVEDLQAALAQFAEIASE